MADNEYNKPAGMAGQTEDRYVCSVLDSMRSMHKARNYGAFAGLIEQVQEYVNRMEDGLSASSRTGRETYDALKEKDIEKGMGILEKRWPRLKEEKKSNRLSFENI